MKRLFACVLVLLLLVSLFAGCKKNDQASGDQLKLALVVAGTFGDRSFYDSAKAGTDRLKADLGVDVVTVECNNENHTTQMRNAADSADMVVCVGWEFYEIETVAPSYPDVKWIWIDNATENPVENLLNITYTQNEGSFLAGYIAAALSKTGTVGAVGGEDSDTINDFIVGYAQGAKYYNEGVKVKGADVIFQVCSAAGDGVFEAGKEKGFYAIGVDSDQKYINPDVIVCSMKKEVGNSIYDAVKAYVEGDDSRWGTTWVADLSTGYVGIGYGEEGSVQQVTDQMKADVEDLTQKIVSGQIVVDTTRK